MLSVGSEFSGIGLLDYGLHVAGLHHAWLCERDEWRRSVLAQRFPGARILDDVRDVGGHLPRVDVIAGGFPCKGASSAGKQEGFGHPETVLWREMARAVGELRPRYVLVENVANILGLHDGAVWGEVVGDLAALGYDTVWDCLPAGAVGAPHLRDRVFAIATYASGGGLGPCEPDVRSGEPDPEGRRDVALADAAGTGLEGRGLRGRPAEHGEPTAADTAIVGHERGWGTRAGRDGSADDDQVAADPRDSRQQEQPPEHGGQSTRSDADSERRGVRVEWGPYGPAIRRWEAVHGPAPEPLVRRVDDRSTSRLERQRLSALGDGVQCQIGWIAGCHIIELERGRLANAA